MKRLLRTVAAPLAPLVLISLLLSVPTSAGAEPVDVSDPEARRSLGRDLGPGSTAAFRADRGMATTSSHHATMAGLETLRAGGNAFDAMAVVQFVLTVAEPYASGIGGGLFIMAYEAGTGQVIGIDGREEAPRQLHPDAFLDDDGEVIPFRDRATGGMAVGVPGTLAATAHLLETHGTLSLAEALEPAIRLARRGYIVTEPFERNLAAHRDRLAHHEASTALFMHDDGTPLQAGDHFRNPDLADTFERIAEEGIAIFYEGEIAEQIVAAVQDNPHRPGLMTRQDMANYRAVQREPVSVSYRGYDVHGMNMPTSGGTTLGLMLNLLERTDYADAPFGSADSVHRLVDAQNLAFADRNRYMGDADFADVPVEALLDKAYADRRRRLMDQQQALPTPVQPGRPTDAEARSFSPNREEGVSTTHFAIVDRDRNVVSVTSTIEQHFGSAITVPGHGFLLNNELTDFNAHAYDDDGQLVPNAPEGGWRPRRTALGEAAETTGGKRPRSSMTPTLVLEDGEPRLALGSPGGSRIIGITLNVLLNVLDHEMDVQHAVNAPRVVARNGPAELEAPLHNDASLREALEDRGFELRNVNATGSVQAIWIDPDGALYGAADPRRAGLSLGY